MRSCNHHICNKVLLIQTMWFHKGNHLKDLTTCNFNTSVFLRILPIFYKQHFLQSASGGYFCQFDKVTVQQWAFADLLFLLKNMWFVETYYKGLYILSEYITCLLLVETITMRFKCLTCIKQKPVKVKHCSKGYLF